jgi:hypothetical protein
VLYVKDIIYYHFNNEEFFPCTSSITCLVRVQPDKFDVINFIIPVAKVACAKNMVGQENENEINICIDTVKI